MGISGDSKTFSDTDREFMRQALALAARAEEEGEVPVGALVVQEGEVVGEGWNRNISLNDPSAHAEIVALRQAGDRLGNYRLPACAMYVTLEPCAMCVSAAIHARIERLVYGAEDPKTGALGGAYDLPGAHCHNHVMDIQGGLMATEASEQLKLFFRGKRKQVS